MTKKKRKLCVDVLKLRLRLTGHPCLCEIWNIYCVDIDGVQLHIIFCKAVLLSGDYPKGTGL